MARCKTQSLFALQLRFITGYYLLYFLCIFLSFTQFILAHLAQLLLQLAIKATHVLIFALFTCTRLTCPRRRRRRRRPPPPPPLSQIL